MSNVFVYVHGTNGSGKSTLARSIIAAAGGVASYVEGPHKSGRTLTKKGVQLLGRYAAQCGGLDGFHPYSHIFGQLESALTTPNARVFCEGLITPGVDTCEKLALMADKAIFIMLDVPEATCIKHVLARRARKSREEGRVYANPFDPGNLRRKLHSVQSWHDRLKANNLRVYQYGYREAQAACLIHLGLLDTPKPEKNRG